MPPFKRYVSQKQERWAHTVAGVNALGPEDVKGKDKASKDEKLPEKVRKVRNK